MPGILDLMEGLAAGCLGALAAVSLQEAGPSMQAGPILP